jgi:hypothetical protein
MEKVTSTYARMEISSEAFDEIASLLRKAGYAYAITDVGLDVRGICLTRADPFAVVRAARAAGPDELEY